MMKKLTIVALGLVLLAPGAGLLADEPKKPESKPPTHTPEWTNPTPGDPGVRSTMDELQKIVVLCATDHSSAEFKRAWTAYVRKHELQGKALDRQIQKVVNEAFRHRQQFGQSQQKQRTRTGNWKSEASKSMHDTAKAIIQKIG